MPIRLADENTPGIPLQFQGSLKVNIANLLKETGTLKPNVPDLEVIGLSEQGIEIIRNQIADLTEEPLTDETIIRILSNAVLPTTDPVTESNA